jgi:hypothetical protein
MAPASTAMPAMAPAVTSVSTCMGTMREQMEGKKPQSERNPNPVIQQPFHVLLHFPDESLRYANGRNRSLPGSST